MENFTTKSGLPSGASRCFGIAITSEYVEADAKGEKFNLPEEHAAVLADEDLQRRFQQP